MNEPAVPPRSVPAGLGVLAPTALLALHLVLLASSVSRKAATVDEFVHVPSGVWYWKTGDFSLSGLNPPLANLWVSLPVLAMQPKVPFAADRVTRTADYPWTYGRLFLLKNWDGYDAMIWRARVMVMVLSVLAGLVLFLWARRTLGFWPATLALALYAVEPNILAHGRLATQDTAMMLGLLLVLVALDGLLERGGWPRVAALGAALGAACLVKFSGLLLALALPAVFAACVVFVKGFRIPLSVPLETRFGAGRLRAAWQSLVALAAVALVALLVVNAMYGFNGTGRRLDPARLRSRAMASIAAGPLGALPVPLPALYVEGLDGQRLSVEQGESINYLNGYWSRKGWWYYYLEAFVLKVPLPVLLLALAGVVSVFVVRPERRATAWVVLVVGVLFWAVHSFNSNKQIGLRYLLPLFPLVFLLAGRSALIARRLSGRWPRVLAAALVLAAACAALDAWKIHPDYLAYFNPVAGGPRGGPRYLLDSNVDWGQDLPGLADWLKREGVSGPVYLGYFGEVAPELYGIGARRPFRGAIGIVAVSVNYVYGMPYGGYRPDELGWLRRLKPVAEIGHTIYVYRTDRP